MNLTQGVNAFGSKRLLCSCSITDCRCLLACCLTVQMLVICKRECSSACCAGALLPNGMTEHPGRWLCCCCMHVAVLQSSACCGKHVGVFCTLQFIVHGQSIISKSSKRAYMYAKDFSIQVILSIQNSFVKSLACGSVCFVSFCFSVV